MTEDELAELECHLAAGTDLPTALATVDRKPSPSIGWWWWLAAAVGVLAAWWLLG